MGKYVRKTRDRWDIEINYGDGYEVECSYDDYKSAKQDYCEYVLHSKHYGAYVRLVKRREKICPTQANV